MRDARPYIRYRANDPQPVREAYADLSQGRRNYMVGLAGQVDGYVIVRHVPPGIAAPKIVPQIRPDGPVRTGPPRWHTHPSKRLAETPLHPVTGKPLSKRHIHAAAAMQRHIDRDKAEDDHKGINNEEIHCHVPMAKYVFPPTPKIEKRWYHDHAEAYEGKLQARLRHEIRYHGGLTLGRHSHVREVKDTSHSLARRIDVHPLAVPKLEHAERVFFVIEGCLKADAILSAGEAVFSVPSVTLWDADELENFAARYLIGKTIIIVPDADWSENDLVVSQALLCRSFLRGLGLTAHVAAPPLELPAYVTPPAADAKYAFHKGVDDYLGAEGKLADLDVLEREAPVGLLLWLSQHALRKDRLARDAKVLEGLVIHAGERGELYLPLRSLARIMDVSASSVERAVRSLIEIGAIESDMALKTQHGIWRGNYFDRGLEWTDRPTLITKKELRSRTVTQKLSALSTPATKADVDRLEIKMDLIGERIDEYMRQHGLFPTNEEFHEYVRGILDDEVTQ